MNIKSGVMTVVAGLALTAVLPVQAQVLGGAIGGAGNAVLGGGSFGGDAAFGGTVNGDMRDRLQAARERGQSTAESTAQRGHDTAVNAGSTTEGSVQKTRGKTNQAVQSSGNTSGAAMTSTSVDKHVGKRDAKADSDTSAAYSADRNGLALGSSHATNASIARDQPAASPGSTAEPAHTSKE